MSAIIAYFSRNGENYVCGEIRNLDVGNTEIVAKSIHSLIGGMLFKLEPLQEYDRDYNECIAQAQADQRRNARPELKVYPEDMDQFDTVYLGFPNYWGTMPMCVFTFLEHFDFSGKIIKPFCTHEGSGFGNSIADIRRFCPKADVRPGFEIRGAKVKTAENSLRKWCNQL